MDNEKYSNQLVGEITEEEFARSYWRQAPLFVKNGASDFLATGVDETRFDLLVTEIRDAGAKGIQDKEEVVFVENISRWVPELQVEADRYATLFGVPFAWFDAVRTHSSSGIGSHFDHSDNFVLQQTGKKTWSLTPPDVLSVEKKAKRMLNLPGVGAASIHPNNVVNFELEAGDFLYIPLFWVHSGLSTGNSLSLSLVCPAVSFQTLLLSSIHKVMKERLLGHQPVPAMHKGFTIDERSIYLEKLRKMSKTLLNQLSSDDIFENLVISELDYLRGRKL